MDAAMSARVDKPTHESLVVAEEHMMFSMVNLISARYACQVGGVYGILPLATTLLLRATLPERCLRRRL